MSSSPSSHFSRLRDFASTPPLSSPGRFSSPNDDRCWERCSTPVSPTPHSTARSLLRYHDASSSPGWPILDIPLSSKSGQDAGDDEFDDERTDDDMEWGKPRESSSTQDMNPRLEIGASANDVETLSAVEGLLSLSRNARRLSKSDHPQQKPALTSILVPSSSSKFAVISRNPVVVDLSCSAVVSQPVMVVPSPVVAPPSNAAVEPRLASPKPPPTTPVKIRRPLTDTNDIDLGDLSDLTPLKSSPDKVSRKTKYSPHIMTQSDSNLPPSGKEAVVMRKSVPKRKRGYISAAELPAAKKLKAEGSRADSSQVEPSDATVLEGFLIETLALARSSSMSTRQLITAVLAEQSHLRLHRSDEEWSMVFPSILGARQVFGRIRRKGQDANGKPIDDQWYYQPEYDGNVERASLLGGHGRSKRTAAKKEDVQYYWKPIPKNRVTRQ